MGNKNTTPNNETNDEKKTTNHHFFENKNPIHNQSNNNNFINEEKKEKDKPQFLDIFISSQKNNNTNNNNNNTPKNYQLDENKYMNWVQPTTVTAYSSPIFNDKDKSAFFYERPALRLDSRLVCKYEVLAVIGKGSFSQVLRVKHRITHQFFAVKLVNVSTDLSTVNNELSILSKVNHNYVIRLEEVFGSSTKLFIVMEMAAGGEMYDRIVNKGRYSEAEARYAIRMLLSGLCYLQSMHITHRDLKPENLLYSDQRADAKLLITDFGLANQSETADELMSETCGTPEYIAPEILLRLPYTNKVDMWAVGVITYILMSGIMPFDDDDRTKLYSHIITADYIYYPMYWSGSELAKEFIDSLLQTNPKQRLCATSALQHDWVLGVHRKNLSNTSEKNYSDRKIQRTKSAKSIRSVTRSDHGHRVDPNEINKLANDLKKLAMKEQKKKSSTADRFKDYNNQKSRKKNYNNYNSNTSSTKHYGVF